MPPSTLAQVLTTELQWGILHSLLQTLHGLHQLLVELMDYFFQETRVLQASPESKGVIWRKRKTRENLKILEGGFNSDLLWVPLPATTRVTSCEAAGTACWGKAQPERVPKRGAAEKEYAFPIFCHT